MLQSGMLGSNLAGSIDNISRPQEEFVVSVFEKLSSVQAVAGTRARGGLPPGIMRRVREYIASHLKGPIENETLANIAGLSVCHFGRAFKQSLGVTPRQFILKCRVERAKELLAGSDLSLPEIAIVTGFADQSHFCSCFRGREATTPGDYRWSKR